jgi:hypothetical protein
MTLRMSAGLPVGFVLFFKAFPLAEVLEKRPAVPT